MQAEPFVAAINVADVNVEDNARGDSSRANAPRPSPIAKPRPPRCPARLRSWRFTHHAQRQCDARGFDPHTVLAAIESPQHTDYGNRPGTWLHKRGGVTVVVHRESRTVVTVLLNSATAWTDDDARAANGRAA